MQGDTDDHKRGCEGTPMVTPKSIVFPCVFGLEIQKCKNSKRRKSKINVAAAKELKVFVTFPLVLMHFVSDGKS